MISITLQSLFWFSLAGLAYIYAGYPLLIAILSRLKGRKIRPGEFQGQLSVVIVACNEAARLQLKLDNLLSLVGAAQIHEILVGSDGSTDRTAAIVANYGDPRVKLHEFTQRRGKPAVLNDLIPRCTGEVVLLADTRQQFDPHLLTQILKNFADDTVGVVSGELVFVRKFGDTAAAEGIGLYWKYEKFLRRCESRFRGVPGATGACYAIRRHLFQPIQHQTLLDDVAIPLQIVTQGYRCVFESQAFAFDEPSQNPRQEAIRKRRTIAGAAQLIRDYPRWLNPRLNPIWFEYVSHKLLRLTSPLLLLTALGTNLLLVTTHIYGVPLALQVVFYLAAGIGYACQRWNWRTRLFGLPMMFFELNWTTALALGDAVRGQYRVTWQRAETAPTSSFTSAASLPQQVVRS